MVIYTFNTANPTDSFLTAVIAQNPLEESDEIEQRKEE